jgi:radical SAM superfamily enzyme YgiQ (UPF0313 family)
VLVLDGRSFAIVDVEHARTREIALGEIRALTHPELAPVADRPLPAPARVGQMPRSDTEHREMTDEGCGWVIAEPIALRLDNGRVLAWCADQRVHVLLDDDHLQVLDRCRDPRDLDELASLGLDSDPVVVVGDLVRLGLLRQEVLESDVSVDAVDPPAPGSDPGSAAEGTATPVRLGRRVLQLRRRLRGAPPDPVEPRAARPRVIPMYHSPPIISTIADGMVEPCLALGLLFAHARVWESARLLDVYELTRLQPDPERVLEEWVASAEPAVFVFADYIWNVDQHLELSQRIKEASPRSICLHGGPSSPKYDVDTAEFLDANPFVDVAARGEGEYTFVEILDALGGEFDEDALDRLASVDGITFRRRGAGEPVLVRTPDRERPADLDQFPSPYLSGEFDDLLDTQWRSATLETNRGCPYGCTFCDWGSATLSRIRKFDLQRVKDEVEWIMSKAPTTGIVVADANFGIFERDVEIVEHIVGLTSVYPQLSDLVFSGVAKNTTKYTKEIYRLVNEAGLINVSSSLSVQTVDPQVLEVIDRKNIKVERFDELADSFAEHSLPMMTDIIFGLPGSTVESFKGDLQYCFDKDVTARVFPLLMLPNSPMNAPEYRERHQIRVDQRGIVVGSDTFDEADFAHMERLRLLFRVSDHFGVFRQLLRFLQWDLGLRAVDVLDRIDQILLDRGNEYPLLGCLARMSDLYTMPPVAWEPLFDEVLDLLGQQYDVVMDGDLRAVLDLQLALLPARGRRFPETVQLQHDVVAYVQDHLERGTGPGRPLREYAPGHVVVDDPGGVVERCIRRNDYLVRRDMESGNLFWIGLDWELSSPLARPLFTNMYLFGDSET